MSVITRARSHETLNEAGQFVSGVASSTAMLGVMMPIDAWATRSMASMNEAPAMHEKLKKVEYSAVRSVAQAVRNGYRGFPITWAGVAPNLGVSSAANTVALRYLAPNGNPTERQKQQATAFATFVSSPLVTAVDRVKIIQQISGGTVGNVVKTVIKNEGIWSLLKGLGPTTVREGAFLYFLFNVQGKVQSSLPAWISDEIGRAALAGVGTGAIVGGLTAPPARVKTLMQNDRSGRISSSLEAMREIVKIEGFGGFLKGAGGRIWFVSGAMGVMAVTNRFFPQFFPASLHRS